MDALAGLKKVGTGTKTPVGGDEVMMARALRCFFSIILRVLRSSQNTGKPRY